jgi:transcriptional regulator with XRE-family HTH domain
MACFARYFKISANFRQISCKTIVMGSLRSLVLSAACKRAANERGSCVGGPRRSDLDRFVGHRIKQLRLLACMSQQQVARQLGVSSQQVHKYEEGINRFSIGRLLTMARVFDVAVIDLFDGYGSGAPLGPPLDLRTTQMLLDLTTSFLELEPKHQAHSCAWFGRWRRRTDRCPDAE